MSGWRAVVRVLRSPADDVISTMFPADCRICEQPLLQISSVPVCTPCLENLSADAPLGCSRCGDFAEFAQDIGIEDFAYAASQEEKFRADRLCRACRLAPPPFARAVSYGLYEAGLRDLLHLFKFDGMQTLGERLGACLAEAMLKLEPETARKLLVVPVPLFKGRQQQRGFNQAALLARVAVRLLKRQRPGWALRVQERVLTRQRSTATQFELSRQGRRRNLRGAFAVTGDVRGREVLLVDDILTSGATARECARVLMAAGATRVWVAVVARAGLQMARIKETQTETAAWDLVHPTHHDGAVMNGSSGNFDL